MRKYIETFYICEKWPWDLAERLDAELQSRQDEAEKAGVRLAFDVNYTCDQYGANALVVVYEELQPTMNEIRMGIGLPPVQKEG